MTNESGALLPQKLDESLLLGYQSVDLGCFTVEESGDGTLIGKWRAEILKDLIISWLIFG